MNIKINSIHFSADKKLEKFIEEKIGKLGQFSDDILGAEVHLSLERSQNKNYNSKVSKIKLEIPGYDLFAEKKSNTFEAATDSAVAALKNQLVKRKEKLRQ